MTPRPARAPSTPPAIAPALLLFGDGFDVGEPVGELDVEDDVESNEAENEVVGKVVLANVVRGYDTVVMRPLLVSVDKVELSVDVTGSAGLVDVVPVDGILLEAVFCADVNTWRSRRMAIKKRWSDTEIIMVTMRYYRGDTGLRFQGRAPACDTSGGPKTPVVGRPLSGTAQGENRRKIGVYDQATRIPQISGIPQSTPFSRLTPELVAEYLTKPGRPFGLTTQGANL